jgi:hypothetical protein
MLQKHMPDIVKKFSQSVSNDFSAAWKLAKSKGATRNNMITCDLPSEPEWVSHSAAAFSRPDRNLELLYQEELDVNLSTTHGIGFAVSMPKICSAILQLKKKHSRAVDGFIWYAYKGKE